MTTLTAPLAPSYSDLISTAPSVGSSADDGDTGFSFHDLLNIFSPAAPSAGTSSSGFSLHDLFSIVNPLQHIPIVSTLYRAVTGDTIKPVERVMGDTLYGGVWGFASSVANIAFEGMTGKDFGDTALALLEGNSDASVGLASNSAAPASAVNGGTVAPATVASIAPQLIASAAPAVLQRQASVFSASATQTTSHMPAAGKSHANVALNQRAALAYKKSLALPTNIPADSIPIY